MQAHDASHQAHTARHQSLQADPKAGSQLGTLLAGPSQLNFVLTNHGNQVNSHIGRIMHGADRHRRRAKASYTNDPLTVCKGDMHKYCKVHAPLNT